MLSYRPGDSLAHRLDPRTKLLVQAGFAVAALAATSNLRLGAIYALAGVALAASWLSPLRVARSFGVVVAVLALAPLVAGVALGPPWFRIGPALDSLRAVLRVPPVLAISAAYVRTTPIRDTRAAIEWLVPGRPGRVLGVGVAIVFRFFPLVVADLRETRTAIRARGGGTRPVSDRSRRLFLRGLERTLARADRLALALRARCFAWNPTLPALSFSRIDYPVLLVACLLAVSPVVGLALGHR
jgi:biotin transport system permease protein